jgi:hypothetical protein
MHFERIHCHQRHGSAARAKDKFLVPTSVKNPKIAQPSTLSIASNGQGRLRSEEGGTPHNTLPNTHPVGTQVLRRGYADRTCLKTKRQCIKRESNPRRVDGNDPGYHYPINAWKGANNLIP